jgi:WD40 repeat protein
MSPVLSPDATRVIYTRVTNNGAVRLWMSAVAGSSPVQLVKGPEATEFAGSWSPDGRWFVYWSVTGSTGSLNRVKTTGDAAPQIITPSIGSNDLWVPIWSPTGDWILHSDDGAKLISPDGHATRTLRPGHAAGYAFSADGRTVYGITLPDPGQRAKLFSMIIDGGPEKIIGEIETGLTPVAPFNPAVRLSLSSDGKSLIYSTSKATANLWLGEGLDTLTRR